MPPFNAIQMGPHTMLDEGIERCLDLIQDTAAINALMVYSRFDVPWGSAHVPADPEKVYECVVRAFEAGAAGIVVSREYEEMRVSNLKAVGRAVRNLPKTSG